MLRSKHEAKLNLFAHGKLVYPQFIKSEILTPLGLTHTFGLLSEVDSEKVSSGYYSPFDKDVKMLDFVSPGGSMIATSVRQFCKLLKFRQGIAAESPQRGTSEDL